MDRREFIGAGAGVLASVSMAPSALLAGENSKGNPTSLSRASKDKPNLVIIHTDEHNFRTLGCYRDTLSSKQAMMWGDGNVVETPHIDAMAKKGALCTNFYATSPVCTPSRAAFISGQYPHETGAYKNNEPLKDSVVTFAALLREQGYSTGYAGKWHLDGDGKPQWDPAREFGFDDNRYMFNRGHWKKLTDTPKGPKVDTGTKPSYEVKDSTPENFATDWLADKTVEFIKSNTRSAGSGQAARPFCYMVSIPDPHGPDSVRAPYDKMYAGMEFKKPHTAGKPTAGVPSWARPSKGRGDDAAYFGMVKCIDDNVGKIMQALETNGVLENTIVVFTADHGDLRGEHGRQNKGVPLEGSAKIPFVIQWPARIKPGTRIEEALGCTDFLPTILAMMGCKTAGKESGRDASGFFVGNTPSEWEDVAFMRKGGDFGWVCATSKRYKLVLSPQDQPWLIDKQEDPDELTNYALKKECRGIVRELGNALKAYGEKHKDPHTQTPKAQYDLAWAVGNEAEYDWSGSQKGPGG